MFLGTTGGSISICTTTTITTTTTTTTTTTSTTTTPTITTTASTITTTTTNTTNTTTTPPAGSAFWEIVSGSEFCHVVDGGRCVTDGAGSYGNNENCKLKTLQRVDLTSTEYDVEVGYDFLTIA